MVVLGMWAWAPCFGDAPPVWQFQGVIPGQTTEKELLAAEQWGKPLGSERIGDGSVYDYRVANTAVRILVRGHLVHSIDLNLDTPLEKAVAAFRLTDPLSDRALPKAAQDGLPVEEGWRPRQFGCARVVVFVTGDVSPQVRRVRFYGPDRLPETLTNSLGMQFKLIPSGEFQMGSHQPAAEAEVEFRVPAGRFRDELPLHAVRITRPFYLSVHEVTVGQFRTFVKASGHQVSTAPFQGADEQALWKGATWDRPGFLQRDSQPVTNVCWTDAQAFCGWLSKQEQRTYRLPTEAEWEYACRAGATTRFHNGDAVESLVKVANVLDAAARERYPTWTNAMAARDGHAHTSPVGSFAPNAFGIYDMHGNVWEWCQDFYDPAYYAKSPPADPPGPTTGDRRVYRGGCWYCPPGFQRASVRGQGFPDARAGNVGFRVATAPLP